jgi:hypothetical protein
MGIIYFDGFDFYNGFAGGAGGRKMDQGSGGNIVAGRFGGQALSTIGSENLFNFTWAGAHITFPATLEVITGFAFRMDSFTATFSGIEHPFIIFYDEGTPQVSIWVDPTNQKITVRTGRGTLLGDTELGSTNYVVPLTLWVYVEIKMLAGNPGSFEIRVNGQTKISVGGIQTTQTGAPQIDRIGYMSTGRFGPDVVIDDLCIIDTQDGTGQVDFLNECRIQTKLPDAEGFQDDFIPSTGTVNANNVNTPIISYTENGHYNYSGTVGAIDLYSIANFTVSGTIFAVQENLSFRKDDVGNRSIQPMLRTLSTNHTGSSFPCYSNYTYAGKIWELNPATGLAWTLTDLNNAEFGITIDS